MADENEIPEDFKALIRDALLADQIELNQEKLDKLVRLIWLSRSFPQDYFVSAVVGQDFPGVEIDFVGSRLYDIVNRFQTPNRRASDEQGASVASDSSSLTTTESQARSGNERVQVEGSPLDNREGGNNQAANHGRAEGASLGDLDSLDHSATTTTSDSQLHNVLSRSTAPTHDSTQSGSGLQE
ncbi:MAG: hypothetical protein SGILL_005670 [Bacillariaceae sp.]